MERRKPNTSIEELDFVKATAWTWYQQGSGSLEGKPVREFNLMRTWRAPGPSRYKLEGARMADEHTPEGSSSSSSLSSRSPSISLSPSHINNSLLDPYEVGRISKHLEYLLKSNSGNYYSDSYAGNRHGSSSPENRKNKKKKKSKRLINIGLLVRQRGICGSRGDVVEGIMLGGRRFPQYGSVNIGLATKCRPRAKDGE
ncbi:uncharacterized protein LOC122646512 [Telopea speciosissima]|uniref:uncharacterized protein LOC122646512 n=1 Tax=Telopea speciosissima TaxID=54955 RepID=UPI001CC3F4BE|nr:uncharacterized protein LOC122646512 [Telopea speciosissima]